MKKWKKILTVLAVLIIAAAFGIGGKYLFDEKTNSLELKQDTRERLVLTTEEAKNFDPASLVSKSGGTVKILTKFDPDSSYEQSLVYQSTKGWNKLTKVVNVLIQPSLEGPDITLKKKVYEIEQGTKKLHLEKVLKSVTSADGDPITNINSKVYPEGYKSSEVNVIYFTSKLFNILEPGSYDVNVHAVDNNGNESSMTFKVEVVEPEQEEDPVEEEPVEEPTEEEPGEDNSDDNTYQPSTPVIPNNPTTPSTPNTPSEPNNPIQPEQPENPVVPVVPEEPTTPETPNPPVVDPTLPVDPSDVPLN